MRQRSLRAVAPLIQLLAVVYPATAEHIIYVNGSAAGNNDGTSWRDAFADLHDALADAKSGDELWIAAGTYKPDRGTGDRNMSFVVPAGVALYGGFAGWEECLEDRDWIANKTILSGDLNGDDGPRVCAETSDCCREHDYPGCDDPLCQELVCGGALNRCCQQQPPKPEAPDWDFQCVDAAKVACCHLAGWRACENSIAVVRLGEGEATTVMDGLILEGAYAIHDGSAVIGGGVIGSNSTALIHNALFRTNVPHGAGGFTELTVSDSAFQGNGDALSAFHGEVANSSFLENSNGLALGTGTVTHCTFLENESAIVLDGDGSISDCVFEGNYGIRVVSIFDGSVTISDSTFLGNDARQVFAFSASVRIDRCSFVNNMEAAMEGTFVNSAVRNSLFVGMTNEATGVIDLSQSLLRVENCTFYANAFEDIYVNEVLPVGVAMSAPESRGLVRNCIFWGVPANANDLSRFPIHPYQGATIDIEYSLSEGWTGALGGAGNSGADPMFVDPIGQDGIPGTPDDDLRVLPGSPAINSGDPDPAGLPATDLDGHARILCGSVDIGAYEFGIGDFNCDQSVDLSDFANWSSCVTGPRSGAYHAGCEAFDFNADNSIDLHDFYLLTHVFVAP